MAHGKRSDSKRIAAAERRIQALELRKAGASYRRIGEALGVAAVTAHNDVHRALADLIAAQNSSAKEYQALELERLDAMLLAVWTDASHGHLGAVDRVLRISERRAKLLGLDAPLKMDVAVVAVVSEIVGLCERTAIPASELFNDLLLGLKLGYESEGAHGL